MWMTFKICQINYNLNGLDGEWDHIKIEFGYFKGLRFYCDLVDVMHDIRSGQCQQIEESQ